MKKFFVFILTFIITMNVGCTTNQVDTDFEKIFKLDYKPNFKIVQLTDIQCSSPLMMNKAFENGINRAIEQLNPDLIVLTGDNVDYNSGDLTFYSFVENMEKLNVKWCVVFGNHDDEGINLSKTQMAETFENSKNCLFDKGPEDIHGVGNYVVHLMDNGVEKYSLFLFDSNTYNLFYQYDYIYPDQIEWYKNNVEEIKQKNNGNVVPSLAFFHIPLCEFGEAVNESQLDFPHTFDFSKENNICVMREKSCCPYKNSGLFEQMLQLESTKAIFCGHDHVNCFDVSYKGIRLNYGLKSSNGNYHDDDLIGAKVITLNDDKIDVSTYLF